MGNYIALQTPVYDLLMIIEARAFLAWPTITWAGSSPVIRIERYWSGLRRLRLAS